MTITLDTDVKPVDEENVEVIINHMGGEVILANYIKVEAEDADGAWVETKMDWPAEEFRSGDTATGKFRYGKGFGTKPLRLKLWFVPTNQIILEETFFEEKFPNFFLVLGMLLFMSAMIK